MKETSLTSLARHNCAKWIKVRRGVTQLHNNWYARQAVPSALGLAPTLPRKTRGISKNSIFCFMPRRKNGNGIGIRERRRSVYMEIPNVQLVETQCAACGRVYTTIESTQITRAFNPVLDCPSCRTTFWNAVNTGSVDGEIIGAIRNNTL